MGGTNLRGSILASNQEFIREVHEQSPHLFEKLAKGQEPEIFVLACCDSRVSPSIITKSFLGDLFVHRNIANQVVKDDESFTASLCYALKYLQVKRIAIIGHTECGGIAAAWEDNDDPGLQEWLSYIKESLPDRKLFPESTSEELAEQNVIIQVERLKNHPVFIKYGGNTEICSFLMNLETGDLKQII